MAKPDRIDSLEKEIATLRREVLISSRAANSAFRELRLTVARLREAVLQNEALKDILRDIGKKGIRD